MIEYQIELLPSVATLRIRVKCPDYSKLKVEFKSDSGTFMMNLRYSCNDDEDTKEITIPGIKIIPKLTRVEPTQQCVMFTFKLDSTNLKLPTITT